MTESTNEARPPRPPRPPRRRSRKRSRAAKNRPVPLHKRSRSHFQQGDRQRGARYFSEGRVSLVIDGTRAKARVEGTERQAYAVGLDWSRVAGERVLHAFCDCQRFAGGSPCKHLWATLLALAETGPENQPPGKDRLGLRKDRLQAWPDLGLVNDGHVQVQAPAKRTRTRSNRRKRGGRGSSNEHGMAISWRSQFASVREESVSLSSAAQAVPMAPIRPAVDVFFLINTTASLGTSGLVLDIFGRGRNNSGKPGKLKRTSLDLEEIDAMLLPKASEDSADALAVVASLPVDQPSRQNRRGQSKTHPARTQRLRLPQQLYDPVLSHLCAKGTLGWWDGRALRGLQPLSWNTSPAWRLALHLEIVAAGNARLRGGLERDGENLPLSAAELILPTGPPADGRGANGRPPAGGVAALAGATPGLPAAVAAGPALVLLSDSIARLEIEPQRDLPWLSLLRGTDEILIPKEDLEDALTALLELPNLPRLEAPSELQLSEERPTPHPHLVLEPDPAPAWMNPPLLAELSFDYGTMQLSAGDPRSAVVDWQGQKFLRRDMELEHAALVRLLELGLQPVASNQGHGLELNPQSLPVVAEPLLADGWSVEVHGATMRPPSPPSLRVESGIDWFELSGEVDFGEDQVQLSKVLDSISRGDRFIELEDGSKGLLPEAWMQTYDSLSKLATSSSDDGLRFIPSQALLVDALLTAMPPAVDSAFSKLRQKLLSFDRIKPKKEPRGFEGTLRGYQREGLGWLTFLREFGLGGVLADDMGLGKTVQVLALLRANRTPSKTTGLPYLVVAPRSVVYNWLDEAAHFTPKLKVIEYSGADRESLQPKINDFDIVVTTYGTLRRDIGFLATVEFDTVILDEAQAIKNPASQ
ncbi:MAG: SNF2-related protein, partial [Acidobacteriota bacterium]